MQAEKSFCANRELAAEVFDAAEAAGVVALEAMRPVHDPALYKLRDEALPQLGRIRRASFHFGKYSSRYDDILAGRHTNIFDCAMASGSLMDIGVYTVEPLIALFGTPEAAFATASLLDADTQKLTNGPIDGAGVISVRYPGMIATVEHSKISVDLSPNQVEGELGTLTFDGISTPCNACVHIRGAVHRDSAKGYSGTKTSQHAIELPSSGNTMEYELADFIGAVEAVRAGAAPAEAPCGGHGSVATFRDITLNSLALMDEARRQTGVAFPADNR